MLSVFFALILTLNYGSIQAQTPTPDTLTYGQVVSGKIDSGDVLYTFKGELDDVVIISLKRDLKISNNKFEPGIRLRLGPKTIGTTKEHSIYYEARLVVALPKDGIYTIVATGKNQDKATTGEFNLRLLKAERLEDQKASEQTFVGQGPVQYFAVDAESPFAVSYKQSDSKLRLELGVNTIKGNGELDSVGKLSGDETVGGTLMIKPQEPTLYVFTIGEAPFSYGTDGVKADYTIQYNIAQ
jgi:hypothetical protein